MAWAAGAGAADFELTPVESQRIGKHEIVIRASLDAGQRRGTVRAAMLIDAPPAVVFQMMTSCADAMQYVPHLRLCRVRDRAADLSWELVEHEIDFGWYAPRVQYVFRADIVTDRSITFHQVSGDFKANQGVWEFEPAASGQHTLLRYRVYMDPPGYVPNWLARSTFKRELPKMLADLRRHCEAEQLLRAQANIAPR
ncbi:MAG TPA: SRPBCC family protein [Steroidobacteraceae bacterium]|jgi:ribosome-associated toxin RatA of RatAB toxin-antitoxin module|nr:SRPBCC family protein [Steroidobacteraceae bacterium]